MPVAARSKASPNIMYCLPKCYAVWGCSHGGSTNHQTNPPCRSWFLSGGQHYCHVEVLPGWNEKPPKTTGEVPAGGSLGWFSIAFDSLCTTSAGNSTLLGKFMEVENGPFDDHFSKTNHGYGFSFPLPFS